jgi:glycerol-3-phosphate dehydrogenase
MLDAEQRRELEREITARSDADLAKRLLNVYGATAAELIELAGGSSELGMVLGPQSEVLVAELEYAFASQWALTITDFLQRRCMSGLGADRGLRDADYAASWLVRLGRLERDEALGQLDSYRNWLRRHRPSFSAR